MTATSFQAHLDFYLPPCNVCNTQALYFTPELLKIFYLARVLFSETSTHKIKSQIAPLLNREQVFSSSATRPEQPRSSIQKVHLDNFINLGKISSISDIAHLLPREHVIYEENIFYKKVANRELIKIDYEGFSETTVSVDNFLHPEQTELNRSQKLYILFDNSTSMNGEKFKKFFVSKAIALEYLRTVSGEQPQIYFRSFHSEVGELVKVGTQQEIHTLINHITRLHTGGGHITNIGDAVLQAIDDITGDPEMHAAEILVITDGFGSIPPDLAERLGVIKLHVLLIPDLDIEKILQMYPNRKSWEQGGPDGSRPMPAFWKYHGNKPPPRFLDGDELLNDKVLSYETASKSIKELKVLEILQGLNQIYTLQEVCVNFIFVVIASILGETFKCSLDDLAGIEACVRELEQRSKEEIQKMANNEKLQLLQTVLFLTEFLTVVKTNATDSAVKQKTKQLMSILAALQARILEDPWTRTMLKIDSIRFDVSFDSALQHKDKQMRLLEAFAFLMKFLWKRLRESLQSLQYKYKI